MRHTITFSIEPALSDVAPRLHYLCNWLNEHPLSVEANVYWTIHPETAQYRIYYGNGPAPAAHWHIAPDYALMRVAPPCRLPLTLQPFLWHNDDLYGIVTRKTNLPQAFLQDKSFAFDWLGMLFFLLSRVEEYDPEQVDDIGMADEQQHLLVREEQTLLPVADRLVAALLAIFTGVTPRRKTLVSVSHDVDALQFFGRHFNRLHYALGSARRWRTIQHWPTLYSDDWKVRNGRKNDPGLIFEQLLTLQPGHLFWGVGQTAPQDQFPDWEKSDLRLLKALADQYGYISGLHPGFGTWKNEGLFAKEKQILEAHLGGPVVHSRQHYLRFAFPETADILEKQGIQTDFSMGYRYHIGFRAGTGFPFAPYHFKKNRPYRRKANPLALMDVAFLRHAGYNLPKARELWQYFFEENAWNTALHLNMHNTGFYEPSLMGLPLFDWYVKTLQS